MHTHLASLDTHIHLTDHVRLMTLTLESEMSFVPGQYILIHTPAGDTDAKPPYPRAYSIAGQRGSYTSDLSLCTARTIEIIYDVRPFGISSGYLDMRKPGDTLKIQGPAGHYRLERHIAHPQKEILFLVTGTGIAPVRSMMQALAQTQYVGPKITLVWGVSTRDSLYLVHEFEAWRSAREVDIHVCVSRETVGVSHDLPYTLHGGHIQDWLSSWTPPTDLLISICGGGTFVREVRSLLLDRGISPTAIMHERFS